MPTPKNPVYTVRKGDCLWTIARDQYGSPLVWQDIARTNGLRPPYRILVGQRLTLLSLGNSAGNRASSKGAGPAISPAAAAVPQPAAPGSAPPRLSLVPEAMRLARPVAYPAFKYKLQDLPKIEVVTPQLRTSLQLKGDLVLQRKGALVEGEWSNEGLTAKFKGEADNELSKLTSGAEIKAPWGGKAAQLKCELAVAAKVDGHVFSTQKVATIPPATFRYTYEPTPVSGSHGDFVFKGTFGYELDVTLQNQLPGQPVTAPRPEEVGKWVAVGLLVTAAAIVVGTIAEDIATGGAGLADDPVSFGAAASMVGKALTAF